MPLLTTAAHYAPSPSQALPDHIQQDPSKYPPRPATRLNLHDDDSSDTALRHPVLDAHVTRSASHSRESSLEKLLAAGGLAGIPESPVPATAPTSPRPNVSSSRQPLGGIIERVVDPKAAAYGHHRQTSIVHGIQHSRNGSLASTSSSPLSPQIIAAAGVGLLPESPSMHASGRPDMDLTMGSRPPTALSGSTAAPNIHPTLQRTLSISDSSGGTLTQRKLERMQSKSRRDHSQHASHSSRHSEQKTVGEYALHVLFTHVRTYPIEIAAPFLRLTQM